MYHGKFDKSCSNIETALICSTRLEEITFIKVISTRGKRRLTQYSPGLFCNHNRHRYENT